MILTLVPILTLLAPLGPLPAQSPAQEQKPASKARSTLDAPAEWKKLGTNLWFDPSQRRLIIGAKVVLREGPLEHLLCLKGTKEHEAILATDAPPRQIHAGLLLTGAEAGHPVRFVPQFEPPTGSSISIELRWQINSKSRRADARTWVRDDKTKKPLADTWVFAGSELLNDTVTKKLVYAADGGDLITVANFGSAILDLPVASSASDAERSFVANTPELPPLGTEVFLILKPADKPTAKKK